MEINWNASYSAMETQPIGSVAKQCTCFSNHECEGRVQVMKMKGARGMRRRDA